jgi:hypothetical protein
MIRFFPFLAIAYFLVILTYEVRSVASAQDAGNPSQSAGAASPDKAEGSPQGNLVVEKRDDGALFISRGFLYRDDYELRRHDIRIEKVSKTGVFYTGEDVPHTIMVQFGNATIALKAQGATIFVPACVSGKKPKPASGPLCDAIGCRWVFQGKGISFKVDNNLFVSNGEGASIEFTKEGVQVDGFTIERVPGDKQEEEAGEGTERSGTTDPG